MTVEPAPRTQQVRELLKSIETGATAPVAVINPQKYIQHNLAVGDGLEGFGALLAQLPKGSARVNTVRVFQDGDFVFAHTDYNFFGPKIGFDIFRFENGKIVEHWDNLQEKPASPNPSGHTMTDGPTEATDLAKTGANKALVQSFVDDILVNGRLEKLTTYIDGERYTQHNPQIGDGLSGLGSALKALAEQGITMKYDRIHKVLGQGNFVLTASEGSFGGKHVAFYDLFRVDDGKIVEHWDTIEGIPPRSEWKNQNGKF
ncbi:MAG TPA: nuclear transport factor 2 family protein [Polyangia bacterium]